MEPDDVRRARKAMGWTQETAATMRGLEARRSWARYESGERPVPADLGDWLAYWAVVTAELRRLALTDAEARAVAAALWEWRPGWLGPGDLEAAPGQLADLVGVHVLTAGAELERPDWLAARVRMLSPGGVAALASAMGRLRQLEPAGPTAEGTAAVGLQSTARGRT